LPRRVDLHVVDLVELVSVLNADVELAVASVRPLDDADVNEMIGSVGLYVGDAAWRRS
jgi:hypothetical protein